MLGMVWPELAAGAGAVAAVVVLEAAEAEGGPVDWAPDWV